MDFMEIANARQSCRGYDEKRMVEADKLTAVLEAARLAPSACNAQPYHFTVCQNEMAKQVAAATQGLGMNKFSTQAPVMIVVSEASYNRTAAMGSRVKRNDYRSIDIGIAVSYLTAEATAQGLSSCILGWLDDSKIRKLCHLDTPVRLVIALGYAKEGDPLRQKKRKDLAELVTFL